MKKETHTHFTCDHTFTMCMVARLRLNIFSYKNSILLWEIVMLGFVFLLLSLFVLFFPWEPVSTERFPCPGHLTWISPSILPALLS